MNQDKRYKLSQHGFIAISTPKGWQVILESDPWRTPKVFQESYYFSRQEAIAAFAKFLSGKLYSKKLGEGFSLLSK